MTELEYEQALKITITADLPHPQGKCGQHGSISMNLCKKCSEEIGIVNSEEYHDYTYSQNRFIDKIRECKTKILKLCSKERRNSMKDREVSFSIVLSSGASYDHSYFVPSNITDPEEIKKNLLMQAFGDKINIEIRKEYEEEE
jgi:hypothetical protein